MKTCHKDVQMIPTRDLYEGKMNKVVLIPDSFKGTMSSSQIISIMKERQTLFDVTVKDVSDPWAFEREWIRLP